LTQIENLIFDLDGTLVDSAEGVVEAVNYSLRMVGDRPQDPAVIRRYIGYPLNVMYPNFTDVPTDVLYSHFRAKADEVIVPSTVPLPGADETLRTLRSRGYRLAIATTKVRRNLNGILDKFGWRRLLAASATRDEVSRPKPDPEMLELTLALLKAGVPQTLMIGDTPNDILAARAVRMKVVAVNSPYGGRERLLATQPDLFIETIADLLTILPDRR
jgi:HAD superfamily hydrolase (TIGR01509 family)